MNYFSNYQRKERKLPPWMKFFIKKKKDEGPDLLIILALLLLLKRRRRGRISEVKSDIFNTPISEVKSDTPINPPISPSKILFMFLGGLPNENNKLWEKFMKTTNPNNYIMVTHPINLPYEIKGYWKNYTDNIIIVDDDHHVKTKWATRSLIDATLLMIQYSIIKYGNVFKKIILVDGTTMPLYNFNTIYKELNKNDKSWFSIAGDEYSWDRHQKIYKNNGGIFDINDVAYGSQWFSLDNKHLKFFINLDGKKTYYVNKDIHNNKILLDDINHIKTDNTLFQKILDSYIMSDDIKKYSTPADEWFFHCIVKHNIGDNIFDHFNYGDITQLKIRSKYDYLNIKEDYNNSKCLMENIFVSQNKTIDGIWIGDHFKINPYNKEKKYNFFTENGSIFTYDEDGILRKITPEQKEKLCNNEIKSIKSIFNIEGGYMSMDNSCLVGKKNGIVYKNNYLISSTYTDWAHLSILPDNILRGINKCINKFYSSEIYDEIKDINFEKLIYSKDINNVLKLPEVNILEKNVISSDLTGPGWHPLEYYKLSIINLSNGYNLYKKLKFIEKIEDKNIWKKTIIESLKYMEYILNSNNIRKDDKGYYIPEDNVDNNILKYGCEINNINLNNALKYGALFIRKVKSNDNIFIDKLLGLQDYIPNITSNTLIGSNMNIFRFNLEIKLKNLNSIDDKKIGHIKPAIQNIILNYGSKIENFNISQGEYIAQMAYMLLNDNINDNINNTQSKIFIPLIWKALYISGYSIDPEWIKINWDNDKILKFNELVKDLSNLEGWSEYAMEVLTNAGNESFLDNDNIFNSEKVINLSNKYTESYKKKNFDNYKLSMYLKYMKYKQKYLQLKNNKF